MFVRSGRKLALEPGAKFKPARTTFHSLPMVWSVEEVHRATDGHEYALLVNTADPTRRKTVATTALLDASLFVPVAE